MEEKEEKLYMPAKINPKVEYLPNITSSELKAILIMAFFSILISCLLYFLNNKGASFVVFVGGLTLSYFLGGGVYEYIRNNNNIIISIKLYNKFYKFYYKTH